MRFAPTLLAAAIVSTPAAAAPFTARDLAAEEGRFAAYSVKHGMRDAFIEFFADNAILLRPDPVNGREYIKARPDPPIVLDWKSQLTALSASGDLGFSTGPWVITSKANPAEPASHGEFFSVWERQPDGQWKVFIDHGIEHGTSPAADKPLAARDLPIGVAAAPADDPEKRFAARCAEQGLVKGYGEFVAEPTRLLRAERVPIDGAAAIADFVKTQGGEWKWHTLRSGASKAGDFFYSLGTWTRVANGTASDGHFVRVFTRDATSGKWMLAGEVLTPRPPKKT